MKIRWLFLSIVSSLLFALPAEAGRLLYWRFETSQNRLVFSTDQGVQPRAQLIPNPTRLVIDLPGTTIGKSTVNQSIGGLIRNVRVGQFDANTARLVIEIAPGYTIDPQQIKIRGASPTQWSVEIPTPQPITSSPTPTPQPESNNQINPITPTTSNSDDFQITRNGLFVRLDSRSGGKINTSRSRDRRQIFFELDRIGLPASLLEKTLPVGQYGVEQIQFNQISSSPVKSRITLTVDRNSPDWVASYSRLGGLVLFPKGGISNQNNQSTNPPSNPNPPNNNQASTGIATIESIELANNQTQLLIRANGAIRATSRWNRDTNSYEISITNARLPAQINGPQLDRNSTISRLRLRQENAQTVIIQVQPALGVMVENLNQPSEKMLALQLRSNRPGNTNTSINVPPPNQNYPTTNDNLPQVPNGRVLVVIDPGHGGKDPGTVGINNTYEKDIILPISQEVAQILQRQGVRVLMTRNSDYFVSLQERSQMANQARANLFVSIHANAISLSRPDVNGLEVFYYQSGKRLAETIHRNIMRRVEIGDRGVKQARFYVLRRSNMPSALVEVGFLTGRIDHAKLINPTFRSQMAQAIAAGILEYIQQNRL